MLKSSFQIKVKSHQKVLDTIRKRKKISGAELARILKMQPSTIVYILRQLKKSGLIEISGIGTSTKAGGKPPVLWQLIADKGYFIGIEIIPKEIRISVIDFACNIIHQKIHTNEGFAANEEIISEIKNIVSKITGKLNLPPNKIIGIGVALPGFVDSKKGDVRYSTPFSISDFPFGTLLQKELELPIAIANDANAGALGIKWFQNFQDNVKELSSNIVYLTINEHYRGIGAGFIIDGKLYNGATGTAGEIMADLPSLAELIEESKKNVNHNCDACIQFNESTTLVDIVKYRKNCEIAAYILKHINKVISHEIVRIIGFFNPDLIVIGGDIAVENCIINEYLLPTIKEKISIHFPAGMVIPDIIFSQFSAYSVSMGATALILREVYSETI